MTDYSDLIKQLRNPRKHPQQSPTLEDEVADALEAQAKQIEQINAFRQRELDFYCFDKKRLSRRIAELEEALKPLADVFKVFDKDESGSFYEVCWDNFGMKHIEAAKVALEKNDD